MLKSKKPASGKRKTKPAAMLATKTRGYRHSVMSYPSLGDINEIPFNGFLIEAMLNDAMVNIAFRMLCAPLQLGKWEIDGPAEVKEWGDKQLTKFQDYFWMLLNYLPWGFGAFEPLCELKDDQVHLRGFRDFHPFDVRPLSLEGEIAGVRVKSVREENATQGQIDLLLGKRSVNLGGPKGLWLANFPKYGSFYGSSAFRPAFKVWLEKTSKDGAEDIRRLWFYKNAYRSGGLYFPVEEYEDASTGVVTNSKDVAQRYLEVMKTGAVWTFPSDLYPDTNERKWEMVEAQMGDGGAGILDYIDRLNNELRRGIGIPDDVIEQPDGGGTYGGRRIGWEAFLVHMQRVWNYLLHTFDEQWFRPAAMLNFGEDVEYQLIPVSLLEAEQQAGQPGQPGQQPGQPQDEGQGGGMPGQNPGNQDGPGFGEHNFAHEWSSYEGAHGGRGWVNSVTKEIRYQKNQPRDGGDHHSRLAAMGSSTLEAFKSVGHHVKHLEHVASQYVRDGVEERIGKLPPKMQHVVRGVWKALRLGTQAAFASFTMGQSLAERVAHERGATPEEAHRLRAILSAIDMTSFKPASMAVAAVAGPGAALGASFVPIGSATYLAYATATNPLATLRAAKKAITSIRIRRAVLNLGFDETEAKHLSAQLLERLRQHADGADWYMALVLSAMDDPGVDLAEAMEMADEAGQHHDLACAGAEVYRETQERLAELGFESDHPREPKGKKGPHHGGEFAKKMVAALSTSLASKTKRQPRGEGKEITLAAGEVEELLNKGVVGFLGTGAAPDEKLTPEDVTARGEAIRRDLIEHGYQFISAKGVYGEEEETYVVLLPEATAKELADLGKKYNQESVLYAEAGANKLIYLKGEHAGKAAKGQGFEYTPDADNYFTEMKTEGGERLKFTLRLDFSRLDAAELALRNDEELKKHPHKGKGKGGGQFVKKASAALGSGWVPGKHPQHGAGWQHAESGTVLYQDEEPGELDYNYSCDHCGSKQDATEHIRAFQCGKCGEHSLNEDHPDHMPAKPAKKAKDGKRAAPGSQMSETLRSKLRDFGMTGTFPPAEVSMSDVTIADLSRGKEALKYEALMSWTQETKSGRVSRQYRYTQDFHDRNAGAKFERVSLIEPHINKIGQALTAMMHKAKNDVDREAAAIASVIRETGLRPTDGDDSVKHGHFGISSLQARHVKVAGDHIRLDFIGKEGVRNRTVIRDPENVSFIKKLVAVAKDGKDFIFRHANSDDAGRVLKSASEKAGGPKDIMLKDLRTLKATQEAKRIVASYEGPPPPLAGKKDKDVKLIKKAILAMSAKVAEVLNNTPTQARDNYIHPEVFKQWQSRLTAKSSAKPS